MMELQVVKNTNSQGVPLDVYFSLPELCLLTLSITF